MAVREDVSAPAPRRPASRAARTELLAWYLGSLRPKVTRAIGAGTVAPAADEELDAQVRELLGIASAARREAA